MLSHLSLSSASAPTISLLSFLLNCQYRVFSCLLAPHQHQQKFFAQVSGRGVKKKFRKLLIYFLAISGYSKNFFFFKKNLKKRPVTDGPDSREALASKKHPEVGD